MDTIWLEITLITVGIVANGFFAGSEIALVSARISRLSQLREQHAAGAAVALRLKESPETFLATIQIAITTVGTLASAVGGATAVAALTPVFLEFGLGRVAQPAALALVIVAITYVSLVIGELVPKAIALRDPERVACLTAPIVGTVSRATGWVVSLLTVSTGVVLRLLGLGGVQTSPFVSEEEVRYLVREGAAKGIFEKVEEELVHNVFEFADTTVREIMTPRMAIKGLDVATPPSEVLARAAEIAHTAFPIWDGSPEQTLGIVSLKDVLRAAARGEALDLARLARPPLYVPDTARISALLRELQRSRQQLAMVVNEHGSVVGLVTIEDVIEEIVGEIRSEGETPSTYVSRLPDGSLLIDGMAPVDEVERALGIELPDSRDYATVAGFLLAAFNSVPARGTSVVATGYRWTVVEMEGPRIRRVRAQPVTTA
ncbi:MAG: HlyC/CorC family transporter [Candidatus Rokubacteria bacterium]|nr:HlyC/CorC family transporter [Candidatus Rokubacteria bacterium]